MVTLTSSRTTYGRFAFATAIALTLCVKACGGKTARDAQSGGAGYGAVQTVGGLGGTGGRGGAANGGSPQSGGAPQSAGATNDSGAGGSATGGVPGSSCTEPDGAPCVDIRYVLDRAYECYWLWPACSTFNYRVDKSGCVSFVSTGCLTGCVVDVSPEAIDCVVRALATAGRACLPALDGQVRMRPCPA
jgi:hypothetical protein